MGTIATGTALEYLAAGLSCLPAVRSGKHPATGPWRTWAERLPTAIEVEAWFANRPDAVCIVSGRVSGNLECMDFDNGGELFNAWRNSIAPDLFTRLLVERTPSGGYHVVYRCTGEVAGNLKLARGVRGGRLSTLIETRGEGGLFLCAPTEGYVLEQGGFSDIPVIGEDAREALLAAARALDESSAPAARPAPSCAMSGTGAGFFERPGDDFAARGDVRPYLEAAGWRMIGERPEGNELWRRPGKDSGGHSATFDGRVFYVFSSNAAPFESERGYNAFQVYAILEHRGDFSQAARTLLEKGFGRRDETVAGVDLSEFLGDVPCGGGAVAPALTAGPDDIPVCELVSKYPKLRPVLIHGFLRIGETMNIIAPPKTGKSWLVTDLALSVATGTPWFGYPCEQGKVLIIDNELHPETSANRIPKVIEARGFDVARVGRNICIENQRGQLKTIEAIAGKVVRYREQGYRLVIVDAFYRAMPRGVDENDNGAIADVYNLVDKFAKEIGCAFVLIHHTSKGNQSQKSVTDVGAGAGSQSRAADTHMILRRHREPGAVVLESVVRSFPSQPPICLKWNWPLWNRDDALDPADLEGKTEQKQGTRRETRFDDVQNAVQRIEDLVDPSRPMPKTVFTLKVQDVFGLTRDGARAAVEKALGEGRIVSSRLPGAEHGQRATQFIGLPRSCAGGA